MRRADDRARPGAEARDRDLPLHDPRVLRTGVGCVTDWGLDHRDGETIVARPRRVYRAGRFEAPPKVVINDGGRAAAGFRGMAGDCVTRAIAIATDLPYREVYDALASGLRARGKPQSARNGVVREVYEPYLIGLGWRWTPTMDIGSGCKVHLRAEELPAGRLVVRVSRHVVAVINGVVHDTYDSTRDGARCVYGYYYWECGE